MKYIVLNNLEIYLFPHQVLHVDHLRRLAGPLDICTGAGFVSGDWKCYGESLGLGIGRGLTDSALLSAAIKGLS